MDQNTNYMNFKTNKVISALSPQPSNSESKPTSSPIAVFLIKFCLQNAVFSLPKDCSRDTLVTEGGNLGESLLVWASPRYPVSPFQYLEFMTWILPPNFEKSASKRLNLKLCLYHIWKKLKQCTLSFLLKINIWNITLFLQNLRIYSSGTPSYQIPFLPL